jgi:hypothetical protein
MSKLEFDDGQKELNKRIIATRKRRRAASIDEH